MLTSLKKYSTVISLLLVLLLFLVAWLYPSLGLALGTVLLVFTLAMACISVLKKHRKAYTQGEITYLIFLLNAALEITGILVATACAAYIGNYMARITTQSISDALIRFAAGVFVGLLIGIAIGAVIRKFWNRFLLLQTK